MAVERRQTNLGFSRETLAEGQHICYIYNEDSERLRLMASFFKAGLEAGEKLLYLVEGMTPQELRARFSELGVNPGAKPGALTVADAASAYCPSGRFNADEMLQTVKAFYLTAIEEGYPGARGTGEMAWCLDTAKATREEVMEYEAGLTVMLPEFPYTCCCQYDARRFDGETLMDVLSVHPMMIVRGQVVRNPFFVPPQEFLREYRERNHRG